MSVLVIDVETLRKSILYRLHATKRSNQILVERILLEFLKTYIEGAGYIRVKTNLGWNLADMVAWSTKTIIDRETFSWETVCEILESTDLSPFIALGYREVYPIAEGFLTNGWKRKLAFKGSCRIDAKVILWIEALQILEEEGMEQLFRDSAA